MSAQRIDRFTEHAFLAWLAMAAVLIGTFGVRYLRGTLGDPDITSLTEAMMIPLISMTVPVGAVAFGVFWPSIRAINAATRGRLGTLGLAAAGAALSLPAVLAFAVGGYLLWPSSESFVDQFARNVRHPSFGYLFAAFVVGGMTVGAGVRKRIPAR